MGVLRRHFALYAVAALTSSLITGKYCSRCTFLDLDEILKQPQFLAGARSVDITHYEMVLRQVNEFIEKETFKSPGRLLRLLDQLGSTVKVHKKTKEAKIVGAKAALLSADADVDRPIWGFKLSSRNNSQFTKGDLQIIRKSPNSTKLQSGNNEIAVVLPASVAMSKTRISFLAFRDQSLFQPPPAGLPLGIHNATINSRVISINVHNDAQLKKGEVITIYFKPLREKIISNEKRSCAYWQFTGDDANTGYWSQNGCSFTPAMRAGMLDVCSCDHLTHFAEILVQNTDFSKTDVAALEIISIVGCCFSIVGLTVVAATAVVFKSWRQNFTNKVWLNLCISILFVSICFLIIVFKKFDHNNSTMCILVGISLHYSVLCSFCWMLVAAVLAYTKLVLVFTRNSYKFLMPCLFSYGIPVAIIGILLSVVPHSYERRFNGNTPTGSFCYPSDFELWLTVYAPLSAILFTNWTLFALIVRFLFATKDVERYGNLNKSNEALKCASVSCVLAFLFGLPWVSGLLADNVVGAYLFTVTATFQGFVLFLLIVLGNAQTRNLWLNKLRIKSIRKDSVIDAILRSTNNTEDGQ